MPEVRLRQGTIAYSDAGAGPVIVLVHGIFLDNRFWDGVVPGLTGFRVIAPTWPLGGHKLAMDADADLSTHGVARLIAEFIETLDLRDVVLVGNDTGGAFAHVAATRHPERIGRLVLNSCDLEKNFLPPLFAALPVLAGIPGAAWLLGHALRWAPFQRLPVTLGWLSRRRIDPALVRDWTSGLRDSAALRRDGRKVLQGIDSRATVQAAGDLARFERPTLWVWGGEDKVFPESQARRIAATMPDARFEVVEGSCTYTPIDEPRQLARLIAEFARPSVT